MVFVFCFLKYIYKLLTAQRDPFKDLRVNLFTNINNLFSVQFQASACHTGIVTRQCYWEAAPWAISSFSS